MTFDSHCNRFAAPALSRREWLRRMALGVGGLGLTHLIHAAESPLQARTPHFAPTAKRVIHIFPQGGPSQVDTFDPKPALEKYHGRLVDEVMKDFQKNAGETAAGMGRLTGKLQRSGFKFARHGNSGLEISELFPKLADHADDLC